MLMKANPANKALADELPAAGLTVQAPFDTAYPVLHVAHVADDVQTEHDDGHEPQAPIVVWNPIEQIAHDDVPF